MITNATEQQLVKAIYNVNYKHGYHLWINKISQLSKNRITFTIRAITGNPGARYTATGRRSNYASWHAHGYLYDELFETDSNIYVIANGKKITKFGGNWQDYNVGSVMYPIDFSELSIK